MLQSLPIIKIIDRLYKKLAIFGNPRRFIAWSL